MKLFQRPSQEVRLRKTHELFRQDHPDSIHYYFDYYEEEISLLRLCASPALWQAGHLAAKEHEDIIAIVQALRAHPGGTRREFVEQLSGRFPEESASNIERSIDLSLRLWLMINIREAQYQSLRPWSPPVEWGQDDALNIFIQALFPRSRWQVSLRESRLDVFFTTVDMVDICGICIHWATFLTDHLRLDRRRRVLSVFAHEEILDPIEAER